MLAGTSESAVGKKLSQFFGCQRRALNCSRISSPKPRRGEPKAPITRRLTLKRAIGPAHAIEIVGEIFAGQIADDADAIERNIQFFRGSRHARRFHLYNRCPGGSQVAFFVGGLRRRDRSDTTRPEAAAAGRPCGWRAGQRESPSVISSPIKTSPMRKTFIERAAEADAADCRLTSLTALTAAAARSGAHAVGYGNHFRASPFPAARPMNGLGKCAGCTSSQWETQGRTFACIGGDKQDRLHAAAFTRSNQATASPGPRGRDAAHSRDSRAALLMGHPHFLLAPCARLRAGRAAERR